MTGTDEELMIAYADGAEAALRELFRRYAPILVRLVSRRTGRSADAEDIVQQTFLQLHRARRDFRREMRFRPWVMTITLNLARDLLRRRGRHPETSVEEVCLPQLEIAQPDGDGRDELCRRVRTALTGLPCEQREVIELHWFAELSFDEVAKVVGVTPGAARVRAHRGYVSLRRCLGCGVGEALSVR